MNAANLTIDDNSTLNEGVHINCRDKVRIGKGVRISTNVQIHTAKLIIDSYPRIHTKAPIIIEDNVIDMRGQTKIFRELAYVVSKSKFTLSNEGLLNHITASVKTKSLVVFSGFHSVEIAKYNTTIPIVKKPQVECALCWLLEKCPKEKKWCMEDILVEDVVNILAKELDI
jgi:ADP-heptose:LPS heptosyltransferase